MTPEKQRIAIAKAVGLEKFKPIVCGTRKGTLLPEGVPGVRLFYCSGGTNGWQDWEDVPDYLSSLDAMHEAEGKALRDGYMYWKFIELLDGIVKHGEHVDFVADRASATAAQRAKALLHTLNLWVED